MDNSKDVLLHEYKIETKSVKRKVIYHFSDVHLTEYDAFSDEQEKDTATKRKQQWDNIRRSFAEINGEPYVKESEKSTYEHFLNMLDVANDGDALVLTGDICDYISGANLRVANAALSRFSKPFVYVKGNHEHTNEAFENVCFSDINDSAQTLEFEDMIILGLDNSARDITAEQNEKLKELLKKDKPILIAMHYPLMTDGNQALIKKAGEYYQLNHDGASDEVREFAEIIKQNGEKIIAVLAGHLHFMNNSEITKGVTQYVSSQGALGNINRYEIGI